MKNLSKYLIFSFFIFPVYSFSSLLHDSIRNCDVATVETLLKQGSKYSDYKPDAIDVATRESTLDALKNCTKEEQKKRIEALLEEYSKKYNVSIPKGRTSFYPKSISDRTPPPFSKGIFIKDKAIKELFLPEEDALIERVSKASQAIKIGPYFVLQQRNLQSCGPAVILMRQMDLGSKPSTLWYSTLNQTSEPDLTQELARSSIAFECVRFEGAKLVNENNEVGKDITEYLQENLAIRGPAIVNGFNQNGGGHWFIVDELNLDRGCPAQGYAIIRDPWHGWRVRISQEGFLDIVGLDTNFISNRDDEWEGGLLHLIWTGEPK